ncbi:hypothetical protein [Wenyingzhuangia sp. 2_MG-2023]|uniref:hypothetical protein n=1 Tax=Wenyingzhuangia sp. 2_MG-2023 TaxID=3062639 RepID=UPI0026E314FA|nr:hypothetical protein [Wenyingzhuangia sp. 2_MG-2023]MDO6737175.1 hypothetical protein [Wenyingzhuangia sp. 2_MG-2023]
MKKTHYLSRASLFLLLFVTCLITVSCSKEDTEDTATLEPVSIQSANFENYTSKTASLNRAVYDFKNTPVIQVEGYNENYTYELKLTGRYLENEYTLDLTAENSGDEIKVEEGKKGGEELASVSVPVGNTTEETRVNLEADISDLDLEVDDYIAVIIEKESATELTVTSSDDLQSESVAYETYVIDSDATNFLSGTQIENYDNWTVLTELNLNSHTEFRVRPSVTNFLNGVGVVLGIYDLDANKIDYISSNGSNGSGSGTYSYKFTASKLNEIITEDGEYLLRLEERTSTIDADDTGYRNGLFQKINITKITGFGVIIEEHK